jgi:hypothetical protein
VISRISHELATFHVDELNPVKLWIEIGSTSDTVIVLAKSQPSLYRFEVKLLSVDNTRSQAYVLSRFLNQSRCIAVVLVNLELAVRWGQVNQKTFTISMSLIRVHVYQPF